MIKKIKQFIQGLKKSSIKLIFTKKGLVIHYTNITPDKYYKALFYLLQQSAQNLGIPYRELMNKLISVDKEVVRDQKRKEKISRYKK